MYRLINLLDTPEIKELKRELGIVENKSNMYNGELGNIKEKIEEKKKLLDKTIKEGEITSFEDDEEERLNDFNERISNISEEITKLQERKRELESNIEENNIQESKIKQELNKLVQEKGNPQNIQMKDYLEKVYYFHKLDNSTLFTIITPQNIRTSIDRNQKMLENRGRYRIQNYHYTLPELDDVLIEDILTSQHNIKEDIKTILKKYLSMLNNNLSNVAFYYDKNLDKIKSEILEIKASMDILSKYIRENLFLIIYDVNEAKSYLELYSKNLQMENETLKEFIKLTILLELFIMSLELDNKSYKLERRHSIGGENKIKKMMKLIQHEKVKMKKKIKKMNKKYKKYDKNLNILKTNIKKNKNKEKLINQGEKLLKKLSKENK